VTDIAGTTRDVLREQIQLGGMPLHIIDTAGLRDSGDAVEQEGVRRARREMETADRILWITDGSCVGDSEPPEDLPAHLPLDRVVNKCDLSGHTASVAEEGRGVTLHLSAKTGQGVDLLIAHLQRSAGFQHSTEGVFLARERHVDALHRAAESTARALTQLRENNLPELAAEDLRDAQQALNEITGAFSSDDLLGRIFAGFCIDTLSKNSSWSVFSGLCLSSGVYLIIP